MNISLVASTEGFLSVVHDTCNVPMGSYAMGTWQGFQFHSQGLALPLLFACGEVGR